MRMNKRKIFTYILWLYGLSFGISTLFFVTGLGSNLLFLTLFMPGYMLIPFISVLIVQKLIYKEKISRPLLIIRRPNWWWPFAMIMPILLISITALVATLFPGITLDFSLEYYLSSIDDTASSEIKNLFQTLPFHPLWLIVGQSLIGGITFNAIFAFGEEIGWRGFLLREFLELGFWKASILIGVIWGVWHAPLIIFAGHNYPSAPIMGVIMMIIFCVLTSPILCWVTIRSRSIFPAAFFHGVINGTASLGLMIVAGGNPEFLNGLTGLAGFIVLLGVNIIIFLLTHNSINARYKSIFGLTENHS